MKISVPGVCIEPKDDFVIKQGHLKRIPYSESREPEVRMSQFLDFSKHREIYALEGDEVYRLKKFAPTLMIKTKDFEVFLTTDF